MDVGTLLSATRFIHKVAFSSVLLDLIVQKQRRPPFGDLLYFKIIFILY